MAFFKGREFLCLVFSFLSPEVWLTHFFPLVLVLLIKNEQDWRVGMILILLVTHRIKATALP